MRREASEPPPGPRHGVTADASDADLLAGMAVSPGLLTMAQEAARAAYLAARGFPECPWATLDGRWGDYQRRTHSARQQSETAHAPNTAQDVAGRVAQLRAALAARDYFAAFVREFEPLDHQQRERIATNMDWNVRQ